MRPIDLRPKLGDEVPLVGVAGERPKGVDVAERMRPRLARIAFEQLLGEPIRFPPAPLVERIPAAVRERRVAGQIVAKVVHHAPAKIGRQVRRRERERQQRLAAVVEEVLAAAQPDLHAKRRPTRAVDDPADLPLQLISNRPQLGRKLLGGWHGQLVCPCGLRRGG
jgi:hypothetical protein